MKAWRRVCGPTRWLIPACRGDPTDDPARAVAVETIATRPAEDRALAALADGKVDCPGGAGGEGDDRHLAAFASDPQRAMAAFEAQVLDVGAQGR